MSTVTTEREAEAVVLLADMLRRFNQTCDALHMAMRDRATLEELSSALTPVIQVFRDDIERMTQEAVDKKLIDKDGEEVFPELAEEVAP